MRELIEYTNLEMLPLYKINTIDWEKSVGRTFIYVFDSKEYNVYIKSYDKTKNKIDVKIENNEYTISTCSAHRGKFHDKIGFIFYNYNIDEIITSNNRNLTINDRYHYKENKQLIKKYKLHCNICNYEFEQKEYILNNGIGCPCCANKIVVKGVNDITTTTPWMIPYFQNGKEEACKYTYGSGALFYPICPDCGRIKDKPIKVCTLYNTKSIVCKCSDGVSYPEKFFISILDQLNIDYIWQLNKKYFEWCDKYKYDFYLKEYNIIVELHGEQHYRDAGFGRIFSKQKTNDLIKKELAQNNGIKFVEINCSESSSKYIINSIKKSELIKIIDIDMVDIIKCDEFASKNIIKEICIYYEHHKPMLTSELRNIFNIKSPSTIKQYLHKGNVLGWCNYDAKESHKYGSAYSGKNNTKQIGVYKDNILIKKYDSIQECCNSSQNDFGTNFIRSNIYKSNKTRKCYKGYNFIIYGYKRNDKWQRN